MVSPRLRELLHRAPGAGDLEGQGVCIGHGEHPVCGDRVQLAVQFAGDRIAALRWRAQACPATVAVAALCAETWPGTALPDAAATLRQALAAHGGLAATERHAEAVLLRALQQAAGQRP